MRLRNIFVLLFLFFGLMGANPAIAQTAEEKYWDGDNYGIVNGWIVDKMTGLPIDEKYSITFFPHDSKSPDRVPYYLIVETDNNLYKSAFSKKLLPGTYYLNFESLSKNPKYSIEPHPFSEYGKKGNRYTIEVKRGQITKVLKKVEKGGNLKINLVDASGNKILFNQPHCNISSYIDSEIFRFGKYCESLAKDDLLDGELIVKDLLYPASYDLKLSFGGCGIGTIIRENINVEKGNTTEIKIVIDLNNPTGLSGYVIDQNKIPIKDAEVHVFSSNIEGSFITNTNGFYKIIGLKEGIYYLTVSIKISKGYFVKRYGEILIKEKNLVNRNITISIQ